MEVVPVSLATDGNYDDDLGHGYIRRPISVAQLMEREGYRPAARSRATRRALTGVAAGAVLALGAVVGSLLLNHATGNTAGDTLAAGSSADVVLGGHQQAAAVSPRAATQNGTKAISNVGQTPIAPNPGRVVTGQPVRTVTTPATGSTQSQPGGTAQTPAPAQAPVTPQSGTSTPTNPTSTTPTGTKPTTTAPTASGGGAPAPSSSSSSNGGLLGAVTGTLTGTLNSVTQPVFSWFG
jgi:hypothetical protein